MNANASTAQARSPSTAPAAGPFMRLMLGLYHIALIIFLIYAVVAVWPLECGAGAQKALCPAAFLGYTLPANLEVRLIVLVVVAGAIGSFIHAATSFATYVGNRAFVRSWGWWYVLRTPIGSAVALLVYFVFRGGLVNGENADALSIPGVVAIAGLAGMFSKQAADKLREVFDNLFRVDPKSGDDQREDKPEEKPAGADQAPKAATIESAKPAKLALNSGAADITVTGKGFAREHAVQVGGKARAVKLESPKRIVVSLLAEDTSKAGTLTLSLVDAKGATLETVEVDVG